MAEPNHVPFAFVTGMPISLFWSREGSTSSCEALRALAQPGPRQRNASSRPNRCGRHRPLHASLLERPHLRKPSARAPDATRPAVGR